MAAESSPLLKGFTQVMSGRAEAKQLGMESLMYRRQADDVDLQSVQASERRREDFRASLASVTANRAARGLSLDTPSGMAVEKELRRQAVRDENVEKVGFGNQAYALRTSATMRRRAASNANRAGWINAGGSIMDAAANVAGTMPGKA